MGKYEYTEKLPGIAYGGFKLQKGQEGIITMMAFGRNCTILYKERTPGAPIRNKKSSSCSLQDLTKEEFQNLTRFYPKEELEELLILERDYDPRSPKRIYN